MVPPPSVKNLKIICLYTYTILYIHLYICSVGSHDALDITMCSKLKLSNFMSKKYRRKRMLNDGKKRRYFMTGEMSNILKRAFFFFQYLKCKRNIVAPGPIHVLHIINWEKKTVLFMSSFHSNDVIKNVLRKNTQKKCTFFLFPKMQLFSVAAAITDAAPNFQAFNPLAHASCFMKLPASHFNTHTHTHSHILKIVLLHI